MATLTIKIDVPNADSSMIGELKVKLRAYADKLLNEASASQSQKAKKRQLEEFAGILSDQPSDDALLEEYLREKYSVWND